MKLLTKYKPLLREHFRHTRENEILDYYLSHEGQNELIERMASKVEIEITLKPVSETRW